MDKCHSCILTLPITPSGVHDTGVVIKALQTKAFFLEISSWLVKVYTSICSFHEPKTYISKSVIYF